MTITFSLEKVKKLSDLLGEVHLGTPPYVHVIGVSGKTSVSLFLTRVLRVSGGLKVGTFIHPPLHGPSSAILVDERPLRPNHYQELLTHVQRVDGIYQLGCTTYEHLFLVAMLAFRECRCQVAVVEAALGGPFDATNLLPRWSDQLLGTILTTVALDHTRFLGPTIEDITINLLHVPRSASPLFLAHSLPVRVDVEYPMVAGPWIDVDNPNEALKVASNFVLTTPPDQQASNLSLALHVYEALLPSIQKRFSTTGYPTGRTIFADLIIPYSARQFYYRGHRLVVDAAQNCTSPLLPWLAKQPNEGINLLLGLGHKDHEVLRELIRASGITSGRKYSATPFRVPKGYPWIQRLEQSALERELIQPLYPSGDYQFTSYQGLREAFDGIQEELIVIFGSPWIVYDFMEEFTYDLNYEVLKSHHSRMQ